MCCKTPVISIPPEAVAQHRLGETLINHPDLQNGRKNLLKNVKDSACSTCWTIEATGVQSSRQVWRGSEEFRASPYRNMDSIDQAVRSVGPEIIEIVLDDFCNLECVYCGPERSTKWQKRLGTCRPTHAADAAFVDQFWSWVDTIAPGLKRITISGGEPFLSSRFDSTLQRIGEILDRAPHRMVLSIITNLSYSDEVLRRKLLQMRRFQQRHTVAIVVSNESYGATSEYIRRGLKWDAFRARMEMLLKDETMTCALMTMNVLSVAGLPQYLRFLLDSSRKYGKEICPIANYVNTPEHLDAKILTPSFCGFLDEALAVIASLADEAKDFKEAWREFGVFIQSLRSRIMNTEGGPMIEERRRELLRYLEGMNSYSATDYRTVFPEYRKFFDDCASQTLA